MTQQDLEKAIEAYFQHLMDKLPEDRDAYFRERIFEAAVMWIKGEDAFDKINNLIDLRDETA